MSIYVNKPDRKIKKSLAMILLLCVFIILAASVSLAYFSKRDVYQGNFGVKLDLMFDRLNSTALYEYQVNVLGGQSEPAADWGSEKNPYIISNIKHLYNLSSLQNNGFFQSQFIDYNYDINGYYINGSSVIPYFIVSTTDGKPVTIDGMDFNKDISPIGTDEFPFVGSVRGSFSDGQCLVAGKSSDVSALYRITVSGNPAAVDFGLFDNIGYLGEEAELGQSFSGVNTTISDIVLADVQIKAKSSLWNPVTSYITDHVFMFSNMSAQDSQNTPHENHHIGILAGHVSYAQIDRISVYYSSDDIIAIDVLDTTDVSGIKANYTSVCGIMGFIDNINPEMDDNGNVTAGSGSTMGDISYGVTGGGGLLSGTQRGYVLASEIYENYKYGSGTPDTDGSVNIYNAKNVEGESLCTEWVRKRLFWGTENTGRYYFYDGVFTFALSNTSDTIETIWPDIIINDTPTSSLPTFSLGSTSDNDWEYGTLGTSYQYYANLTPVTTNTFSSSKDYVLGWKDSNGNLYLADLSTQGTTVPANAITSFGGTVTPNQSGYEMVWNSSAQRKTFEGKMIGITAGTSGKILTGKSSGNKLGLQRYLWFIYRIYNGKGTGSNYSYDAILVPTDPYWGISYTIGSTTKHLTASSEGFTLSDSGSGIAYQMYFYEVELGVRATNEDDPNAKKGFRQLTDPVNKQTVDGTDIALTADKYVLWPNSILDTDNNDDVTVTQSQDPVYSLKSVSSLGWKNRLGTNLGETENGSVSTIDKMFRMTGEIQWGMSINLFGGTFSLSDNNLISAPIGSDGTAANIPMGCVAFKMNKATEAKVRVIVAVPVSSVTSENPGALEQTEDYYFGLWYSEPAGDSWAQGFDKSDAIKKFELPRSQPKADTVAGKADYINVEIDADGDGTSESYRAYLQGETVLVAYEFSINQAGVYILGATNGPMQIVYFSADGVASNGRDGVGGSNLGTIDYVYDYNNSIIPVTEEYTTNIDGTEDYNTYYPSFCIIYYDNFIEGSGVNGFSDINNGYFSVYRRIDDNATTQIKSILDVKIYSGDAGALTDKQIKADTFSHLSDNLNVSYTLS